MAETMSMTVAEIGALVKATVLPAVREAEIVRVDAVAKADAKTAVFASNAQTLAAAILSRAGLILVSESTAEAAAVVAAAVPLAQDPRLMRVRDARLAFSLVARELATRLEAAQPDAERVHPTAVVAHGARVAADVCIAAGAVIEDGVTIGAGSHIGPRAVVHRGVTLGKRVRVQAGAVIGASGFGYARDPATGEYILFPQQGTLAIEDDVEIGANTTIDRGALGETRIGAGTKIDNLVHIAHNCRLGKNVVIAAQVGIAGSSVVEDGAVLGGQAGLGDHVHVGPGVLLGGQAGIYPGATLEGAGEVFTGTPAQPVREHLRSLAKLRRLK
jgi:UDP-3-O-[3-hydroxymyristoyl] glucosamine N-acyltransferase